MRRYRWSGRAATMGRAWLLAAGWGCGGPTEATDGAWLGSGGLDLSSASLTPNIQAIELRLDGTLEHRHVASGAPEAYAGTRFVSRRLPPGSHTMTLRIVTQAASPHDYDVVGGASFLKEGTQETASASCGVVRRRLATGDEVACSFTLP